MSDDNFYPDAGPGSVVISACDAHSVLSGNDSSISGSQAVLADSDGSTGLLSEEDWELTPGRIPHRRECLPRRPARRPAWQPRRDRRDAGHRPLPRSVVEGWRSPFLTAAADLGPMRINFTYRNVATTNAGYGEKPRRDQYFEGPYEPSLARFLEVVTNVTDYQFQPLRMNCYTSAGTIATYTTDVIYELANGDLVAEEVKATSSYFEEVQTRDLLQHFEKLLAAEGVQFNRRVGQELTEQVNWRTIKNIFDNRRTVFTADEVDHAQNAIVREGGCAPLAIVLEALRVRAPLAEAKANAMMVSRHIAIDLARPPMADTRVTIPSPPQKPGALRRFLRKHAVARQ